MNGIARLEKEIRSHPILKMEDHAAVHEVCSMLAIGDKEDLLYLNELERQQVDIEASMVYLVGKYSRLVNRLKMKLTEYKAEKMDDLGARDEEGLKWNKTSKEQYLLANDAEYAVRLEPVSDAENLLILLKGLSNIVFNRDSKLEQLSINYRREIRADSRAQG